MPRWSSAHERFMARIQVEPGTGCWLWTGHVMANGYGQFYADSRLQLAHRWAYEHFCGPIPAGLHAHHTCENRRCANPSHIEPLTVRDHCRVSLNSPAGQRANQTHCKHGHEFTPANTGRTKQGYRRCRACHVIDEGKRYARRRNQTTNNSTKGE